MKKLLILVLLAFGINAGAQTTLVNKLRGTGFIKKNNYTRVLVQDSINGDVNWVLKSSLVNDVPNLDQVLTEGNTSDQSIELNNGFNQTIIEPSTFVTQNITTTAGVNFSESGVGIFTQNESLGVEIKTDSISESYVAQFPAKVIIDEEPEIFVFQSDLTAFSATIGSPTR